MRVLNRDVGATLLELLVVMTIMLTMLGLVSGATIRSLERAEAQTEVISVYSLIKRSSIRAFSSGNAVFLKFLGSDVDIYLGGKQRSQLTFEHLQFEDQSIAFNRNGMADQLDIQLNVGGVAKTLDLRPLFGDFTTVPQPQRGNREF